MLLFNFATMEFEINMQHFWGSSQLHQKESFKMNRTSWHNLWTTFEHLNHRKHRKMAFNAIWTKIKFKIHDKLTWPSPCTHEGGINSFWCILSLSSKPTLHETTKFPRLTNPILKIGIFSYIVKAFQPYVKLINLTSFSLANQVLYGCSIIFGNLCPIFKLSHLSKNEYFWNTS